MYTLCFALTGCFLIPKKGKITIPGATVIGVPDAGKPATLDSDVKWEGMTLPKGSSLTLTKFEAIAATPETKAEPAKEVAVIQLSEATEWKRTESVIKADTGTVDTSIAKKRIDAEESRILLYVSMLAAVAAGVFEVWLHYRTPALLCAGASAIFFAAWKVASLPPHFFWFGVVAVVAGVAVYFAHEKGEKHAKEQVSP